MPLPKIIGVMQQPTPLAEIQTRLMNAVVYPSLDGLLSSRVMGCRCGELALLLLGLGAAVEVCDEAARQAHKGRCVEEVPVANLTHTLLVNDDATAVLLAVRYGGGEVVDLGQRLGDGCHATGMHVAAERSAQEGLDEP